MTNVAGTARLPLYTGQVWRASRKACHRSFRSHIAPADAVSSCSCKLRIGVNNSISRTRPLPPAKSQSPSPSSPFGSTRRTHTSSTMPTFSNDTPGNEVVTAYADRVPGKTILITGPSESGVGAQTAIFFAAAKPALIILAGRTLSKIQPVIDQIAKENPDVPTKFVALDLADNASVRKAAAEVKTLTKKLDILVNNAGVMAIPTYETSKDGIEMQFAANHIGHFLLTNLLMPEIIAAGPDSRIINVSSLGYMSGGVHFDDPNFSDGKEYNPWYAYAQSKTANILFTHALADRLKSKGVHSFTLNPGLIFESKLMANISKEMFAEGHRIATAALKGAPMPSIAPKSLAAGSSTTLYGALDPELASKSGAFLNHGAIFETPLMEHATGVENQDKLWAVSEKLVGEKFSY